MLTKVKLILTKVRFLKIFSFFAIFDPNLTLTFFKCVISSYKCLTFALRCLYNYYILLHQMHSPCKIWIKPIDNTSFFIFYNISNIFLDLIWPKFCPKTTHVFFMVSNIIFKEIQLITLIAIQYFWKIFGKTSKSCHLLDQLRQKMGQYEPCPPKMFFVMLICSRVISGHNSCIIVS